MAASPYTFLDYRKKEIRLFRVSQAAHELRNGEHLHGSLEVFELDKCPRFQALSYMWGTEKEQRPLILNDGHTLQIQQNLHSFLVRYSNIDPLEYASKFPDVPRTEYDQLFPNSYQDSMSQATGWLWIDQVCIDQHNLEERSAQVRLMKQIYLRAYEVIIWLGEDTMTMASLEKLQIMAEHELLLQDLSPWSCLSQNPYWERLWIVQEVLLACKCTVMSGDITLPWTALASWYQKNKEQLLVLRGDRFSTDGGLGPSADPLFNLLRHAGQLDGSRTALFRIDQAIGYFSWHLCADPRDKIYALLGIIDGGELLNVDYSLQPQQLFEKVIHFGLVLWRIHLRQNGLEVTSELSDEILHALWQLGDGLQALGDHRLAKHLLRLRVEEKWQTEFI